MPFRYCIEKASTKTRTPLISSTASSSSARSSMLRLYLKPLHPPGITATRSPADSAGTDSALMNFRTSVTALSVSTSAIAPDWVSTLISCSFSWFTDDPRGSFSFVRDCTTPCKLGRVGGRCQFQSSAVGIVESVRGSTGLVQAIHDPICHATPHRQVTPLRVCAGRVHSVGQHHDDKLAGRVHPDRWAGEAGMPDTGDREEMPRRPVRGGRIPPQRSTR